MENFDEAINEILEKHKGTGYKQAKDETYRDRIFRAGVEETIKYLLEKKVI